MTNIQTNRELYQAILHLSEVHQESDRSLEQYLLTLEHAAQPYSTKADLTASEFVQLLEAAFTQPCPVFDQTWQNQYETLIAQAQQDNFAGWQALIRQQIVNLREMDESGDLQNEQRFFGIDAPRGNRWYNFTPQGYLECAMAGALGGWDEEEDVRTLVPGKVAVLDEAGNIRSVDPQDIENPVVSINSITWAVFKDFLICGQIYE